MITNTPALTNASRLTLRPSLFRNFSLQQGKRAFIALTVVLMSNNGFSQTTSRVWVTVDDPAIMQATPASPFDLLLQEQAVTSVRKAFPNAHTPSLQKVYELQCSCNNEELEKQLMEIPGVSGPVAIYESTPLFVPNDYSLNFQPDYALDLINAPGAWEITHGDSTVILGITDVNYDMTHEELLGKVVAGGSTGPSSYYHGTAVAITAAGNTNNGVGKSSIGYNCKLALQLCQYNDLLVARDNGAKVVNASWHDGNCAPIPYCQDIINELYNDGVIVVAAAGNGAVTCGSAYGIAYPAAYNHVISVSSIGPNDNHERYPGDATSAHQHNAFVDLCAPGYDVPLTVAAGWYLTGNGSSFAAPFVTGTIGLMLSVNKDLTVDDLEYILKTTAVNIDAVNPLYAGLLGSGKLDAQAAVEMAANYDMRENNFQNIMENPHEQSTAGIDSEELAQVRIYPNPSAGEINILYPFQKGQVVEIIDMTGRSEQVILLEMAAQKVVPENLSSGMYQVVLKDANQVLFQQRIIIL